MAKPQKGVDPVLKDSISKLMTQVMDDPNASLTDKMKVLDRALKLAAIEAKMDTVDWGSALFDDEEDEPAEEPKRKK